MFLSMEDEDILDLTDRIWEETTEDDDIFWIIRQVFNSEGIEITFPRDTDPDEPLFILPDERKVVVRFNKKLGIDAARIL